MKEELKRLLMFADGNKSEIARQLNVTRQSVDEWFKKEIFPINRALELQDIYGIDAKELVHPDLIANLHKLI